MGDIVLEEKDIVTSEFTCNSCGTIAYRGKRLEAFFADGQRVGVIFCEACCGALGISIEPTKTCINKVVVI